MKIFTIGYSDRTQQELLALLQRYSINCLLDVRSVPTDMLFPAFNSDALKGYLKEHGVVYMPFGKEFGERRADCLDKKGRLDYSRFIQTADFQHGAARLKDGLSKGFHIALMGAAGDPLRCHRCTLVARYLHSQGMEIRHILPDGTLLSHADTEGKQAETAKATTGTPRATHNALGKWGEDIAADYLEGQGFVVLERNWHYRHREIDIIALQPDTQILSFVEVKTRRDDRFGDPELAVSPKKMWFLATAANHYIRSRGINNDVQFDIVAITGTPKTGYKIRYIPDAIPPSARTTLRF